MALFKNSLFYYTKSLNGHRSIFTSPLDYFKVTSHLWAEPLKKKKKLDPAILKAREDRKIRRLEKEIRRLEKNVLQFKPIDEKEVTSALKNSLDIRARKVPSLSEEEENIRFQVAKNWCKYKYRQHLADFDMINRAIKAREIALKELRQESEELYQEAIEIDLKLFPFACKGPVFTPAIEEFESIDGDFKDITKNWDKMT